MELDLSALRMNFFTICERCVLKEKEVKESIDTGPATLPPLEHLFVRSVFLGALRQFTNLFIFDDWGTYYMTPRFRRAVTYFKEASSAGIKAWCKQYEQRVNDLMRVRRRMFEHRHGQKAGLVGMTVDHLSPTLAQCPMLNQKAIKFAAAGCDALLCSFHVSRYFHEVTELNRRTTAACRSPQRSCTACARRRRCRTRTTRRRTLT